MRSATGWPMASSRDHPKRTSACRFQSVTRPESFIPMNASPAVSMTARVRSSLARRASSARRRSTTRLSWEPTWVASSRRDSSGSSRSSVKNSRTATTSFSRRTGKPIAALIPACSAAPVRGKFVSAVTSITQAGRPDAATRPGRPAPTGSGV